MRGYILIFNKVILHTFRYNLLPLQLTSYDQYQLGKIDLHNILNHYYCCWNLLSRYHYSYCNNHCRLFFYIRGRCCFCLPTGLCNSSEILCAHNYPTFQPGRLSLYSPYRSCTARQNQNFCARN